MPRTPVDRPAAPVSRGKNRKPGEETPAPLSRRERHVLSMLAHGVSGSEIADALVLSPNTVRTHIRNAMSKLGASSRAQAVALAMRAGELEDHDGGTRDTAVQEVDSRGHSPASISRGAADPDLRALLNAVASFPDIEGGAAFVVDESGLTMRRAALVGDTSERRGPGRSIGLGEGPVARAALERMPQRVQGDGRPPGARGGRATMYAPIVVSGRLLGVISVTTRPSRPASRSELLLLQAFATRLGKVLLSKSPDRAAQLRNALERFRTAWTEPAT
jgi:DNA-binding CsgD family transcriptional regulator